jgi:hypothetical protein
LVATIFSNNGGLIFMTFQESIMSCSTTQTGTTLGHGSAKKSFGKALARAVTDALGKGNLKCAGSICGMGKVCAYRIGSLTVTAYTNKEVSDSGQYEVSVSTEGGCVCE